MQISQSFDPHTLGKIKHSFLLGLAGFVTSSVPVLLADPAVTKFLQDHMYIGMLVASFVPVVINAIKQWYQGQPKDVV